MRKSFISSVRTFTKNLAIHAKGMLGRHETLGEAKARVSKDVHKLKRTLLKPTDPQKRREASRLIDLGRLEYNARNYEAAEEHFKAAVRTDGKFAMAYTFLGHALYKQDRLSEAMTCWERATIVEPDSPAASKARRKIQHVEKSRHGIVERIAKEIRGSKR